MRKIRAGKPRLSAPRAGNAGLIATVAIAFAGVAVGAISAYMGERGARATAKSTSETAQPAEPEDAFLAERDRIVAEILSEPAPERLTPPTGTLRAYGRAYQTQSAIRPKIVIIIDDMGINRQASEKALELPGPLTFSFLPYGRDVAEIASAAHDAGGELMLHLPMEPEGVEDPGPHALTSFMTGAEFMRALDWNLGRFDGYVGVNNHMGSKLTADIAAMKTLLGYLDHKGVFFLDSVTTPDTAARRAARELGLDVYARDVFLDAEAGSEEAVRSQLALAERIARKTGYAVAIGHPRKETLAVLGPWLTSAPARGFDLVYASALKTIHENAKPKALAAAPSLRL
ncbi:divergent polysaccharide deacetylase family protein [Hyphococcus luteus]|nr:divergent polysaccharide deacetylase family protein [Marinicaulis flavus]